MNDMFNRNAYIFEDEFSPEESVNAYNLQLYTTRAFSWDYKNLDVSSVRELHIIGDNTKGFPFAAPLPGCYFSEDKTWLLLLKVSQRLIRNVIAQCREQLECLDIRFNNMEKLGIQFLPLNDGEDIPFPKLTTLKLIDNHAREDWYSDMLRQSSLKNLDLRVTERGMSLNFTEMKSLEVLKCQSRDCVVKISGLLNKKQLQEMNLFGVTVSDSLYIGPKLEKLELDEVFVRDIRMARDTHQRLKAGKLEIVQITRSEVPLTMFEDCGQNQGSHCRLPALKKLNLEGCSLNCLPDLSNCSALTEVGLRKTKVTTVVGLPSSLKLLDLSETDIEIVPEAVSNLKELTTLNLRCLTLKCLPQWLSGLGLPLNPSPEADEGILLYHATVAGVKQDGPVIQPSAVRAWLQEQQKAQKETNNEVQENAQEQEHQPEMKLPSDQHEVKVIFLGDGEAGKSMLIKRLCNKGDPIEGFIGNSTPGIAIAQKNMVLSDAFERTVRVNYWEFGGQEILHSMHRAFMTQNTVYVVILNARNDTQDDRARFWLQYLKSAIEETEKIRVLLVVNKMDQNPQASLNETELKQIWPELGDTVYISALTTPPSEFNKQLTERLIQEISKVYMSRSNRLPHEWAKVKEALEEKKDAIIEAEDYYKICSRAGIANDKKKRDDLAQILCEYGTCFRCGTGGNKRMVLLKPEWATNAVYKILANKHEGLKNGVLSYDDISTCITSKDRKYRCVRRDFTYLEKDVNYILDVMHDSGLSFRLETEEELIPMLCSRNAHGEALKEFVNSEESLEVWWQFDYLPNSLFFRLITENHTMLQKEMLWMNGAVFRQENTANRVLVRRDGNTLKFHARGEFRAAAKAYLSEIEDAAYKIVKVHHPVLLKEQEVIQNVTKESGDKYYAGIDRKIILKDGEKREVFDFRNLKIGQIKGMEECYSVLLGRRIPVSQVLTFGEGAEDFRTSLLLQDILEVCVSLQGVIADDKGEDSRNTQIAMGLQMKGYYDQDQSLSGISDGRDGSSKKSTGKKTQPGRLDIKLNKRPGTPWAIIEGMDNRTEDYWKRHLNKLMKKYNTQGMKVLFLVTYLDTLPENFESVCQRYFRYLEAYTPTTYHRQGPVQEVNTEYLEGFNRLQAWKCTYAQRVKETTVYHIFVQMGKPE